MPSSTREDPVAILLERVRAGDRAALDELVTLVYHELRHIARGQRRRAGSGAPTLGTTALVHEAYLRLERRGTVVYETRGHFLAVAATAMRQLLVDEARHRVRRKRGGGERPATFDERDVAIDDHAEQVLAVDQALCRLGDLSPRLRDVVECRFFAGLTEDETAEALGVTARTVRRDWLKARGWLGVALGAAV